MPVELLLDAHAKIAESPLWAPDEQALYWADIKAPALHWLDPASLARRAWPLPADIGAFALMRGGKALVALRTGLFVLTLADGDLELVAPPPFDPNLFRFNEGGCDAAGRFWVGVMFDSLPGAKEEPARSASLSSWSPAEGLVRHADFAELHNGMAWSPDGSLFYLSHSRARTVYAIDFDPTAGRLGERRAFAVLPPGDGIPDGAAVDETGAYWCAVHGAGCLHRYSASGELIEEVALPVSQPTMCAFGGPELATLFVTSAADGLSAARRQREPHAGALFRLDPGVRGAPKATHVR